ncbi:MAG: AI-2E family transporter, partial [Pseudomonadota bacterium]
MALPIRQQVSYWSLAALVFLLLMWALGDVILPFIVGMAIAYFLDPVADRLEAMGLSRIMATVLISITVLLIFVLALLIVVPVLIEQLVGLVQAAPQIFSDLRTFITERFPSLMEEGSTLNRSLTSIGEVIQSRG